MQDLIKADENLLNDLLMNEQMQKLIIFKDEMQKVANNHIINNRTDSQLLYSVLNDGDHPTIDAKYWQIFREIQVSFSSLLNMSSELEVKYLELEEIEIYFEEFKKQFCHTDKMSRKYQIQERKKEIEIQRKKAEIENYKNSAQYKFEELNRMYAIYSDLKNNLTFSDSDPNEHQIEAILKKVLIQLEIAFSQGRVELNAIYDLIAHLRSFKRAAIENNMLNKIKENLTSNQLLILEEKFLIRDSVTNQEFDYSQQQK